MTFFWEFRFRREGIIREGFSLNVLAVLRCGVDATAGASRRSGLYSTKRWEALAATAMGALPHHHEDQRSPPVGRASIH